MAGQRSERTKRRLSGEDLTFWWTDSPMQPTTMAMLMLLDRAPPQKKLRAAFERAVAAVPRLAQRVVDAPLDLTLPHWQDDPTFDLDYHLRRHQAAAPATVAELFREIAPAYETPFDRSRPLWEARLYEGLRPSGGAALFFKLHHALADGIGGNAIFAALTDGERAPVRPRQARRRRLDKGAWPAPTGLAGQLVEALRDRVDLDLERARALGEAVVGALRDPSQLVRAAQLVRSIVATTRFDSHSPLKDRCGRARRLSGMDLPFAAVHALKQKLGGSMIDVLLTIMAMSMREWHARQGLGAVRELMTLVPVNLRQREQWTAGVDVGNFATGILVPLPLRRRDPLATFREIHRRMEEKKRDPLSMATPALSEMLSVLPRPLVTWMSEASFGSVDFIVTNVPGIMVPRYLAGAAITATYPFAPVAVKSPLSVALYGYCDRLFIGLDSDENVLPDVAAFEEEIRNSLRTLTAAARTHATPAPRDTSPKRKKKSPHRPPSTRQRARPLIRSRTRSRTRTRSIAARLRTQ